MGLFSNIFGRGRRSVSATPMSPQRATEIINRYGSVLECGAPAPGCVADISKLPFSKEQIREAFIVGLRSNTDAKMKEMLKVAFMELANWQPGVGPEDQGLDTSKLDLDGDVEALARAVLVQTDGQKNWNRIVIEEQASLKAELVAQNLW